MIIFAIDDEPKMLWMLHKAVEEAAPGEEFLCLQHGVKKTVPYWFF